MTRSQSEEATCWVLYGIVAVVLLGTIAAMCAGDPIDATVRLVGTDADLRGQRPSGTGTVFGVDGESAWILTCGHVVKGQRQFNVEFWRQGWHPGQAVQGTVGAVGRRTDSAIIKVPLSQLGGYVPPAIPFATERPRAGQTVLSVGCANGTWPTMFRGHVLQSTVLEGRDGFTFLPVPASGRSGSAIFDATGAKIVGVLHSQVGEPQAWGSPPQKPTKGGADYITAVAQDLLGGRQTALPMVAVIPAQYRTEDGNPRCLPGSGDPNCQGQPGQNPGIFGGWLNGHGGGIFGRQEAKPELQQAPPFIPTPQPPASAPSAGGTAITDQYQALIDAQKAELDRLRAQAVAPPIVQVPVAPQPVVPSVPMISPVHQQNILETGTAPWLWTMIAGLVGAVCGVPFVGVGIRMMGPKLMKIFLDMLFNRINDPNDKGSDEALRRSGKLVRGEAL